MADTSLYRNRPLGQILKHMELISEGHLQEALQIQRKQGGLLGEVLVRLGYVTSEELQLGLAAQKSIHFEVIDVDNLPDLAPPGGAPPAAP